jgi:NADH/NAD ratio-sensing transcriptional regulator Rex
LSNSEGFNQLEIAARLQVDDSTISRDLASLKEQARRNIKVTSKKLLIEFEKWTIALNAVRKKA